MAQSLAPVIELSNRRSKLASLRLLRMRDAEGLKLLPARLSLPHYFTKHTPLRTDGPQGFRAT